MEDIANVQDDLFYKDASKMQLLSIGHICSELDQEHESLSVPVNSCHQDASIKSIYKAEEKKRKRRRRRRFGGNKQHFIKYSEGGDAASLNKVDEENKNEQVGGGIRGLVEDFSVKSRSRLMWTISRLKKSLIDSRSVKFLTMTYDGDTEKNLAIDGREYKRHLKNITQAISRKYGGFGVWRWELQNRLIGHWHMIWYNTNGLWIDKEWLCYRWNEIIGGNDKDILQRADVENARSWKGARLYGCKVLGYVAKEETALVKRQRAKQIGIGRHWGTVNKKELEAHVVMKTTELLESQAIVASRVVKNRQVNWSKKAAAKAGDYSRVSKIRKFWSSIENLDNLELKWFEDSRQVQDFISFLVEGTLGYQRVITKAGIQRVYNKGSKLTDRQKRIKKLQAEKRLDRWKLQMKAKSSKLLDWYSNYSFIAWLQQLLVLEEQVV